MHSITGSSLSVQSSLNLFLHIEFRKIWSFHSYLFTFLDKLELVCSTDKNYFSRVLVKWVSKSSVLFMACWLCHCFEAQTQSTGCSSLLVFTKMSGKTSTFPRLRLKARWRVSHQLPVSPNALQALVVLNSQHLHVHLILFWEILCTFSPGMAVGGLFITHSGFGGKFGLVCHLDFVTHVASQGLMTCLQMGYYLLQSCRIKLIVF